MRRHRSYLTGTQIKTSHGTVFPLVRRPLQRLEATRETFASALAATDTSIKDPISINYANSFIDSG